MILVQSHCTITIPASRKIYTRLFSAARGKQKTPPRQVSAARGKQKSPPRLQQDLCRHAAGKTFRPPFLLRIEPQVGAMDTHLKDVALLEFEFNWQYHGNQLVVDLNSLSIA